MKWMRILFLALTIVIVFSCDDDPHNDGDGGSDSDSDSDTDSDFEWCDESAGLCWQLETTSLTWSEAIAHCVDLSLGDHNDWYLPSIDEFRTLIRGCPATETGGECPVVDGFGKDEYDIVCLGCEFLASDNSSSGCYWNDTFGEECLYPDGTNWSSSEDMEFTPSDSAWRVGFDEASINSSLKDHDVFTRCVRTMD